MTETGAKIGIQETEMDTETETTEVTETSLEKIQEREDTLKRETPAETGEEMTEETAVAGTMEQQIPEQKISEEQTTQTGIEEETTQTADGNNQNQATTVWIF